MHNGIEILDPDKPSVGARPQFQRPQQLQVAVDDILNTEEIPTLPGAGVAEPNKMGRPLKFPTPQALQEAVEKFFVEEPYPTLTGLGYHLELSRSSMFDYRKRDEFSNIMGKATQRIEVIYEKRLIYENGKNTSGIIFALKRMGWREKGEVAKPVSEVSSLQQKLEEVNRLYLQKRK